MLPLHARPKADSTGDRETDKRAKNAEGKRPTTPLKARKEGDATAMQPEKKNEFTFKYIHFEQ